MPGSAKQNSMFKKTKGYIQQSNPFAVTSCGRRRNDGSPLFAKAEPRRTIGKGKNFNSNRFCYGNFNKHVVYATS